LTVGQRVRLTIFLAGEPLEVGGLVVATAPLREGEPCGAEVALDALSQDQATALEGFILDRRTAGRPALDSPGRSTSGLG